MTDSTATPDTPTAAPSVNALSERLVARLVDDAPRFGAIVTRTEHGTVLVDAGVQAPGSVSALLPYSILFECEAGDIHHQFGGAAIYVREGTIVIVPEVEKLDGDLLARRSESVVRLTVPAGELKPGAYQVQLAGTSSSRTWTLQVH